jgi:hypothetical protein
MKDENFFLVMVLTSPVIWGPVAYLIALWWFNR